jgi:CrcB protein
MQQLLMVAVGGACGALLRYGLSGLTHRYLDAAFPWGTLVVNLTGCFAIGFLWALYERAPFARLHPLVFTGVLGAFTTFSTFGFETFQLLRDGEVGRGLANVAASTLGGLALVFAGFVAARLLVTLLQPGSAP